MKNEHAKLFIFHFSFLIFMWVFLTTSPRVLEHCQAKFAEFLMEGKNYEVLFNAYQGQNWSEIL
jgi:hypothetical protein